MRDVAPDLDDAGIFAIVMLATIGFGAGLVTMGVSLWWVVPASAVFVVIGEVAARQLAQLKARQEVAE